jgi:uncharacterized membrane protein HdeD (DUF308 family)
MVSTSGFMIGVVGGLLDFASATNLLISRATQEPGMVNSTPSNLAWIVGLYVLGAAVIISAVLSVMSPGFRFPRLFSALMMAYGAMMIASGWVMTTGNMLGTTDLLLYGYGMVVVGALMFVNGVTMVRSPMSV